MNKESDAAGKANKLKSSSRTVRMTVCAIPLCRADPCSSRALSVATCPVASSASKATTTSTVSEALHLFSLFLRPRGASILRSCSMVVVRQQAIARKEKRKTDEATVDCLAGRRVQMFADAWAGRVCRLRQVSRPMSLCSRVQSWE
ncbi:uncharacterized protein MYCGRDRAFT_106008 [Zymoseptoria tritici IPO323]|uniref:Uncharacterized protein n=1 Tax=Zymoseptoria tritici (strain CBS 115943 / IPO323) TaxID=336722 RepID=F9XLS3_ZYMTI|nr:uncharacterized protein MYCGRDRAFT_106008 [Zymoseptoria tritici IPO323]EGP84040.1 hypothetical protein MYCGRDRAFT_106008 [Zymoseptoria tritici IPO323]